MAGDRPPASGVRIAAPVAQPDPPPTPAFAAPAPEAAAPPPSAPEAAPPVASPPEPEAETETETEPEHQPDLELEPAPAAAPAPPARERHDTGPVPIFEDEPRRRPADEPPPTPAFPSTPAAPRTGEVPIIRVEDDADDGEDDLGLSHVGHGPEAPGPDWGGGMEAPRPVRRATGWSDDPDDELDAPLPQRGLVDRYRWSPTWVKVGLPLAVIAAVALLVVQLTGGDDDAGTRNPFGNGDGTLEQATADEPGMGDAVSAARGAGVPEPISDQELSTLVKGVCSAARRSLVPLNLSESLAASGVEVGTLETAATAIGTGALEFCPDQEPTIPQVVSVLVARTERMLGTASG